MKALLIVCGILFLAGAAQSDSLLGGFIGLGALIAGCSVAPEKSDVMS